MYILRLTFIQFIDSNVPVVTPPDANPEDPIIGKTVNNQHNITLENRDDLFTWRLTTRFGNSTADWSQAVITDEVHEFLDVVEYRLVDLNGNDVSHLGNFNATNGNTVVFTFEQQDGSYEFLTDQVLVLEIDAKINSEITDEQLAPYTLSGGIPNQGRLDFGNEGDVIHTNIPRVTPPTPPDIVPPPEQPTINKTVNGDPNKYVLENRDEVFTWEVRTNMGNTTAGWSNASIVDEVHEFLDVLSYKLIDSDGNDMSHLGNFDASNGNSVIFTFVEIDGSFAHLAQQNYILVIDAKINSSVTNEQLAPYIIAGGIPNQARLNFGGDGQFIDSNIPVVIPPDVDIESPSIGKTVDGVQMLRLENRSQLFTWELTTRFGNDTSNWSQAAIVDEVHEFLDVVSYRIVDLNGNDVSHLGEFKNSGNTVRFEFTKQDGSYAFLSNQVLRLEISSKINDSITDEQLAPYIAQGGIPNQGRLEFGNEGDVVYSNIPVVYPPINVVPPIVFPKGPKLPETGMDASIIALSFLSIVGTGLVVMSRKKRKQN